MAQLSDITGMIPAPQFGDKDWFMANARRLSTSQRTQDIAVRLLREGERMREATRRDAQHERELVEGVGKRRVEEEDYWRAEVDGHMKGVAHKLDQLCDYKRRVERGLEMGSRFLEASQTCLIYRSKRMHVDNAADFAHKMLLKSTALGKEILYVLTKHHFDLCEQIRIDKSLVVKLREILTEKNAARDIDETAMSFNPPESAAIMPPICPSTRSVSYEAWRQGAHNYVKQAERACHISQDMSTALEKAIEESARDLRKQQEQLMRALEAKVEVTRELKARMEASLQETKRRIEDMEENLQKLEDHYKERMCRLSMTANRLHARNCRPMGELTRDSLETALEKEAFDLGQNLQEIELHINQSRQVLRSLIHDRCGLEADIDTKSHSLKVDEVDCLGLLASIITIQP